MTRFAIGLAFLSSASMASAETDFGIRTVSGERTIVRVAEHPKVGERDSSAVQARVASELPSGGSWTSIRSDSGNLNAAAGIGSRWGRVTSTYRTPQHNRRVGGVRNSYHIRGRAIDIARRPGVTHSQIAASFRNAGYQLIESPRRRRSQPFRLRIWGLGSARGGHAREAGADEMGRRHRLGGASPLGISQHLLHAARRLAQPLFVLNQRDADITFAFLAEADARRDGDMRFRQQPL